jgi:glycine cleavage system H lipoate-binding protein
MQHNVYEFKLKKAGIQTNGVNLKKHIAPDQPFDYDEVAKITGPEYVRYLNRNGIAMVPYEEVKRNFPGRLLKTSRKPTIAKVSGFQIANDYFYHPGHSWAHMEPDGRIRIGIDDFTARVFGPADIINLPSVGDSLIQGEVGWELNRNGHKAPMVSPVSGTVISVNDNVIKRPNITNDDPYNAGYLLLLDSFSPELDMKTLYIGKECFQWMEKEHQSLMEMLGAEYERLAATGAESIKDIYGHVPDIDWDTLVSKFLKTKMKR